jgi:hypothetical protein
MSVKKLDMDLWIGRHLEAYIYIYNVSDIGSFENLWLVCFNCNLFVGDVCVVVLYIYITALICNQCLSP